MRIKCDKCRGSGRVKKTNRCPACQGLGTTKITLGGKVEPQNKCQKCAGSGKVLVDEDCYVCNGSGNLFICDLCDRSTDPKRRLCPSCYKNPIVFELKPPFAEDHIIPYHAYLGKVTKVTDSNIFIDLGGDFYGSAPRPPQNVPDVGGDVIAKLMRQSGPKRFDLYMITPTNYSVQQLRAQRIRKTIEKAIEEGVGKTVFLQTQVIKIIHTTGPTIYSVIDESGSQIDCVAYTTKNITNFEDIKNTDIIDVYGKLFTHKGSMQIEIYELKISDEETKQKLSQIIEKVLAEKTNETLSTPFLIENEILSKLRPAIEKAATRIRQSIFSGQNIVIRHHADADGVTGGIAIEESILALLEKEDIGSEKSIRRIMTRNPSLNMGDCSRDLEFALGIRAKQNIKLPLFVIIDFGSSIESLDAYELLKLYNIDTIVIDHHPLDPKIEENVSVMVNPYSVGGNYNLTAGMVATEVAQLILPDIIDKIKHLPAVAAKGDMIKGETADQYIAIVNDDLKEKLISIAQAIDYECFYLRYSDGQEMFRNILGINTDNEIDHDKIRELLSEKARESFTKAIEIGLQNLQYEENSDTKIIARMDTEKFTHKYIFPPPRKIIGSIHDYLVQDNPDKKIITLGEGRDTIILRSEKTDINFPEIVKNIQDALPSAGIIGGGHEFVGSVKYFEGKKDEVTEKLISFLKEI